MAPEKNFKLSKYEHIIYHFKAYDLEISLIYIVFRNILLIYIISQKQISRNSLKGS